MITLILCFFAIILSVSTVRKEKYELTRQQVREHFAAPDVGSQLNGQQLIVGLLPGQQGVAVERGERYTAIDMSSAPFFSSGSAELQPAGGRLLMVLLPTLQNAIFKDYQITVEGHTDDEPINTPQFPSNWELSTARAAAVVRFLVNNGIPAAKLRAVGYADALPKLSNRDAFGRPIPENQAQNRRVIIKLERIEKD